MTRDQKSFRALQPRDLPTRYLQDFGERPHNYMQGTPVIFGYANSVAAVGARHVADSIRRLGLPVNPFQTAQGSH